MDPLIALNHLLNFVAPAAVLAVLLAPGSRWLMGKSAAALSWWAQAAIVFAVGCGVLAAGLWWLGRDGKLLTYAALVLACATCQWVLRRGWRG
ncbi:MULTISPECIES: hypothetical protein [unclassified Simplicispira]|jgi:Flp pilus assembly protein protease CpaA|uniref:hypothetical protein n=1 Tax=unclassified Simplicispira TaxID=2630407 RepID=UPI000D5DD0C2|nr:MULTISPECIES: hypothetical protein [unclassified Simplicispira]PVY54858.1 hypothetical protein C8D04_0028 [Simplicispira sp. 125]REG15800.1 hypothetical protein C8D01_0337 [Simplicispira sp. 110]